MIYLASQIGLSMGPLFGATSQQSLDLQPFIKKFFDPFVAPVIVAVLGLGLILSVFVGVFIWRMTKNPGDDAERRSAPWIALDLITVVLFFVLAFSAAWQFIDAHFGITLNQTTKGDGAHPLAKLASSGDLRLLVLSVISGVVVTPICEEVFFRVLFLGWLNAVVRRAGRYVSAFRNPNVAIHVPLLISSTLFAAIHFRTNESILSMESQAAILVALGFAQATTIAFAVVLLRWRVGATSLDFGWNVRRIPKDFLLGFLIFLTATVPLYMLQFSLGGILKPMNVAPDPGPMFVFAYLLGLLYLRTGRLAPCVAVHVALNALAIVISII